MTRGVQKAGHLNATRNREFPFAEAGVTEYGWVVQMLGNMRVKVRLGTGQPVEKIGVIRGNMRKRQWISVGDLVLVSIREFQGDKVDVIFKYSDDEVRMLKRYKEPVGQHNALEFASDPVADTSDVVFHEDTDSSSDVDLDNV